MNIKNSHYKKHNSNFLQTFQHQNTCRKWNKHNLNIKEKERKYMIPWRNEAIVFKAETRPLSQKPGIFEQIKHTNSSPPFFVAMAASPDPSTRHKSLNSSSSPITFSTSSSLAIAQSSAVHLKLNSFNLSKASITGLLSPGTQVTIPAAKKSAKNK